MTKRKMFITYLLLLLSVLRLLLRYLHPGIMQKFKAADVDKVTLNL